MTSYLTNRSQSTGANWLLGLGSAVVFGVSVTNCIVYSNGTSGSQNTSSGSGGTTSIDSTCATIMLVINIILAIISFIYMLVFIWRALTMSSQYIVDRGFSPYQNRGVIYREPPVSSPPMYPPTEYATTSQPAQVIKI